MASQKCLRTPEQTRTCDNHDSIKKNGYCDGVLYLDG